MKSNKTETQQDLRGNITPQTRGNTMEWLSGAANIAQLLCLPAAIAAIPGLLAVFSDSVRNWLTAHRGVPIAMIIVLAGVVLFDVGARLELFPKGWFSPRMETEYRRNYHDETLSLDNKAIVECVIGDNVTIRWNGAPFGIQDCQVSGKTTRLATDNKTISETFAFLNAFRAMGPNATLSLVPNRQ